MSSNQENLRGALRLLAEETQGMEASSRVREALQRELRGRRRKSLWRAWWPMAAVAAACLVVGVWLGTTRQQAGRVAPAPPVVAETRIVDPEVTPAVVEPPQPVAAVPPASEVQPAARRATYTAPAAPRAAGETGSRIERPVSPWYFYTGLPAPAQGQVVRVMVSAQTASQYGVVAMGTTVPAQIFIGDDGLARAIRFVR